MNTVLITILTSCIMLAGNALYGQTATVKYYDRYGVPVGQARIEAERNPYAPTYVPTLPTYEPTMPIDMVAKAGQYKQQQYDMYKAAVMRSINQLLNSYNSYSYYPAISDGWHRVYLTNGATEICYTECRVKEMRVLAIRTCEDYRLKPNIGDGESMEEYILLANPKIVNARATVALDNTKGTEYQTLYFMDDIAAAK